MPAPRPTTPEDRRRREAVLELARSERRRVHPALLHVGVPAGRAVVLPSEAPAADHAEVLDHAAKVDLLSRLMWVHRRADPLVWLTRTGPLEWQDLDAAWLTACRAARAETGVCSAFLVVTRHGWWEPETDALQRWRRIRDRRRSA